MLNRLPEPQGACKEGGPLTKRKRGGWGGEEDQASGAPWTKRSHQTLAKWVLLSGEQQIWNVQDIGLNMRSLPSRLFWGTPPGEGYAEDMRGIAASICNGCANVQGTNHHTVHQHTSLRFAE